MLREKGTGASPLSAGPSTVLSGEETPLRDEPIGPKAIRSVARYLKGNRRDRLLSTSLTSKCVFVPFLLMSEINTRSVDFNGNCTLKQWQRQDEAQIGFDFNHGSFQACQGATFDRDALSHLNEGPRPTLHSGSDDLLE